MQSMSRVADLAGNLMTEKRLARLRLSDFGETFQNPETNQSRRDRVFGSTDYIPDVAEEETRLVANDRLRRFVPVNELLAESPEVGPFFPKLPKGMTAEQAIEKLLRTSPSYVVQLYEMTGARGRFDILNLLPRLVSRLVGEGVYSLQLFQQTHVGTFSAYRVLRGHAADERRVIGSEGGIACRILEILDRTVHQGA
ncbi:MAG: hypothetical protein Q8R55_01290 [Candidatus Taylorbacteria bacterium]|nr:hypothetical protein [Candidatus Taylorbacteria bacterium]